MDVKITELEKKVKSDFEIKIQKLKSEFNVEGVIGALENCVYPSYKDFVSAIQ
jgi:hypothetical protein